MEAVETPLSLPPGVLSDLERHYDADIAAGIRARLDAIEERLTRTQVTIAFGGHFSGGKSTVLNTLIGRSLLPTSDYPETGVACAIRSGESDTIVAETGGGRIPLPFGTRAIADTVSLTDMHGGYREEIAGVDRILITLAGDAVPPDAVWIDSPGINDSTLMADRAARLAGEADVLVWVAGTRQFLSEVEGEFLRSHTAAFGPESVAFLVNVFLPADTREHWEKVATARADYYRDRIIDVLADGRPPLMALVSARAATIRPDLFGGPQACGLIASLSSVGSPRIRAARLRRAANALRELAGRLDAPLRNLREQVESEREDLARRRRELAERSHRFESELYDGVRERLARHIPAVERCGEDVAQAMGSGPLRGGVDHAEALASALRTAGQAAVTDLLQTVQGLAVAHGRQAFPPDAATELRDLLSPPPVAGLVPDDRTAGGPPALNPAVENILPPSALPAAEKAVGWMRRTSALGRRTLEEAREAGRDGERLIDRARNAAMATAAALQADRLEAQANARAVASRMAAVYNGGVDEVCRLAMRHCTPLETAPPDVDGSALHALESLVGSLLRQADRWEPRS